MALLCAGILLGGYALLFDTSVASGAGGRIINQGLSNDRLIYMLAAVALFVGGIVVNCVGRLQTTVNALARATKAEDRP